MIELRWKEQILGQLILQYRTGTFEERKGDRRQLLKPITVWTEWQNVPTVEARR